MGNGVEEEQCQFGNSVNEEQCQMENCVDEVQCQLGNGVNEEWGIILIRSSARWEMVWPRIRA